jgi:hypothetical protein
MEKNSVLKYQISFLGRREKEFSSENNQFQFWVGEKKLTF